MRIKTRQLKVLLLKGKTSAKDALKEDTQFRHHKVSSRLAFEGNLYVRPVFAKQPSWVSFVKGGLERDFPELDHLKNSSTAAVLFVSAEGRVFAFTFGHGRNLLKPDSFETDFGLKTVLNSVDPSQLRSIDVRTFEELTLHTRRQTSRGSGLESFGLDISRDLLRAVTGQPRDRNFAKRVSGADALSMNLPIEFTGLADKCKEALKYYGSVAYKERFGWIDQLRVVRDSALEQELAADLIKTLRAKETDGIHLAPPEPIDWESIEGFSYSNQGRDEVVYADLDIDDYLKHVENLKDLTLDDLKRHQIRVHYAEQGMPSDRWSLFQCLVFEHLINKALFVLSGGQWFQVADTFAGEVDAFVSRLPASSFKLPSAPATEKEQAYNTRVSKADPRLSMLDQKLVRSSGGPGRIEACDLYSDRHFIHVKRKTRSATLSHLFAQGAVSAEIFVMDRVFRDDLRSILSKINAVHGKQIPVERPDASKFTVVYAIIAKPRGKWPLSLPFFSRLHLMQAARRMQALGYSLNIDRIDEV